MTIALQNVNDQIKFRKLVLCVPKEIDIHTEYFKYFFTVYILSSGNTLRVFTVTGSLQNFDFNSFNACNSHRYFCPHSDCLIVGILTNELFLSVD